MTHMACQFTSVSVELTVSWSQSTTLEGCIFIGKVYSLCTFSLGEESVLYGHAHDKCH